MADITRLTVVGSQGEADVVCALLRVHGIRSGDRRLSVSEGGGIGGWTEVLVSEDDLEAARELLAARPEAFADEDEGGG